MPPSIDHNNVVISRQSFGDRCPAQAIIRKAVGQDHLRFVTARARVMQGQTINFNLT